MSPKWIYNSGSLSRDHSPPVTSLFRICPIRSAFVESNLVREVTSLLIFTILYTVRVAGLACCDIQGSPTPVPVEVLKSLDFRNLLARRMYREIGNGEARNIAVLTCCWGFTGDKGSFSSQALVEVSSFFSSRSKVESLEGLGLVELAFVAPSESSGSEYRNLSI